MMSFIYVTFMNICVGCAYCDCYCMLYAFYVTAVFDFFNLKFSYYITRPENKVNSI